jgi:hypothetical protein
MDAGYGGPVWHASIARHGRDRRPQRLERIGTHVPELYVRALHALRGVGSAMLGEWIEHGDVALHLRRRCTVDEWGGRPWGIDLRHTDEGRVRLVAAGCPLELRAPEW